uniref:Reverse transcriptase Ty1/copia-type domain-containing protein n=1 Tax=Tanacetum cinerariifolium TaxID=118510 RepID=A0A699JL01_TANCI|nr:hypothetical protein [Tanacetum cinerariifolium]
MARLVANGSTQLEGIDVDETFSLVVKPGTIQNVFSLAISRHWPIHQLDVKNAFLHDDLSETVYMHQPLRFRDSVHPDYVCLLHRSLYGLKRASRAWFQRFASYITRVGFHHSRCDSSLFIYRHGIDIAYLLLYRKYVVEILERAHMVNCNSSRTPVDTEFKLGDDGDLISVLTLYGSLADHGLQLFASSTTSLIAYLDANLAGCPTTMRSTSEAEYRGVANYVVETCWLRNLLRELHTPLSSITLIYRDNVSAFYLSCNPVQHQRTKHIEIDIHFVRHFIAAG